MQYLEEHADQGVVGSKGISSASVCSQSHHGHSTDPASDGHRGHGPNNHGLTRLPPSPDSPFEPDGVLGGVPYKVQNDGSIDAIMQRARVKFRDLEKFHEGYSTNVIGKPHASRHLSTSSGDGLLQWPSLAMAVRLNNFQRPDGEQRALRAFSENVCTVVCTFRF
jgi:hypothetical protein